MEFLLGELRRQFPQDWDRAGDDREQMWRPELYNIFSGIGSGRFITTATQIKIRHGARTATDIDAVVFDSDTGVLGLFQLKWQDLFGRDPYKRSSRMKNFLPSAQTWVDTISTWLTGKSHEEICSTFRIRRNKTEIKRSELFVLGRSSAHFSGQTRPDPRAAWGTWPQVLLLLSKIKKDDPKKFEEDPLTWLASQLRVNSPFAGSFNLRGLPPESLRLDEITITVEVVSDSDIPTRAR